MCVNTLVKAAANAAARQMILQLNPKRSSSSAALMPSQKSITSDTVTVASAQRLPLRPEQVMLHVAP